MTFRNFRLLARLFNRLIALSGVMAFTGCTIPGPTAGEDTMDQHAPRQELRLSAGYTLSFAEAGSRDGQPVIFVHGTPGDAGAWADYLMNVPKGYRYITMDRPGFGRSGPADAITSLTAQANAVAELIRRLGPKPAALVGHSLGGPIIAQTAVDHPELVAALVIVAGSLDPAQESVPFIQYVGNTWPLSAILPRALRNANREVILLEPQLKALAARLSTLKLPVTIVHGTKDDLVPFANVAFMKTRMTKVTGMEVTVLEGQNHFLPWNSKKQVDAAIMKALAMRKTPSQ
ncbi:MAG: alpha/beta hydrolase [Alphaproteobacteria bacterium]|nr:alpha/beta hydrolase [Alphaproteobacteria bacterium]